MYEHEKKQLLSNINPDLLHVLKKTKSFIAGGAVTSVFSNKEINDYDIYVRDKKSAVAIVAWCMGQEDYTYAGCDSFSASITSFTERSITFIMDENYYQIVLFDFFDSVDSIFDKFDFYCCMGAYDFEKSELALHEQFLPNLSKRLLTFNPNTSFPIVSALRVDKYKKKGYTIPKTEFIKIILACSKVKIISWEELASHCGGLYGTVDESVFDTEKPFTIDEAIKQLSTIGELSIRGTSGMIGCFTFKDVVTTIHGDVPLLKDSNTELKGDCYYKTDTSGGGGYRARFNETTVVNKLLQHPILEQYLVEE